MISKSLSTSEKFASLVSNAGKLAEFCQVLYMLIVAHGDDHGCVQGDVFTVKHLVHPTSPRSLKDFDLALRHLHNVGLITWYQVPEDDDTNGGKWVVFVRGWLAHQQLKGHESRKRTFPPPPENPSKFNEVAQSRPSSPKPALREENLREEKRREPIQSPTNPGTEEADEDLATGVTNADVHGFLKRFCELYTKHRHGARYMVRRERDIPNAKRLLAVYGSERLEKLAVVLFGTDDEWISGTDRGIGILSTKVAWLDGILAEHEQRKGVA